MALSVEQAQQYEAAHSLFVEVSQKRGLLLDYSLESLKTVERFLADFRRLLPALPGSQGAAIAAIASRAGAYVAEVIRRTHPEADVSLVRGEFVVTLPSQAGGKGVLKLRPAVRTAKLLTEEETLFGWAIVLLAMAGLPNVEPG
jgi:hypothetical protein